MRISQVGVLALMMIIAASLAPAEADGTSATVRVNVNVAEWAKIETGGDIYLAPPDPYLPFVYQGETSIWTQANFDYQLSFTWIPEGDQGKYRTIVTPEAAGPYDALDVHDDVLAVKRQTRASGSSAPLPDNPFKSETVGVYQESQRVGHVQITLTHGL